jgi:hypothetical protein
MDDDDFKIELDRSDKLSNGDKVKLTITCSKSLQKELGVTLVCKSKEYKAEGLEEAKKINPFDYASVNFSGTSPNARVSISNNASSSEDNFVKSIYFKVDKSSGIAAGDTITVSVATSEESAIKKGYIFTETSKTYTCDNVDQYVTDVSKLSNTDYASLQKDAKDKIEAYFAGMSSSYGLSCKDLNFEGSYLLTRKSGSDNRIYLVFSGTVSASPTDKYYKTVEDTKVYFPVYTYSVMKKANGSITHSSSLYIEGSSSVKYGYGSSIYGYTDGATMYKEIVTANKDNYNYQVNGGISSFGK